MPGLKKTCQLSGLTGARGSERDQHARETQTGPFGEKTKGHRRDVREKISKKKEKKHGGKEGGLGVCRG